MTRGVRSSLTATRTPPIFSLVKNRSVETCFPIIAEFAFVG